MVTIHALCLAYVVCSSDYSCLDIVWAKLLSMIYMYLGFGKVGFCEMFAKRRTLQKSGSEVLREEIFMVTLFHGDYTCFMFGLCCVQFRL